MANRPNNYTLRLSVAKLLELSYSTNDGLTTKILRESGDISISVDERGKATLSGKAGVVRFSANDVTNEFGLEVRRVGVSMSVLEEGELQYEARFMFANAIALSARGTIDVEQLILSCSGLLCRAARAAKQRTKSVDRELEKALGTK